MTTIELKQLSKTERLTDAFKLFNKLSENLAHSYQGLEGQVAALNRELAAARDERVSTLIEKEKLANRLQQILAALPAAVVLLNGDGRVIDCNNHAVDFLGEPLIGESWQSVTARGLQAVPGSPGECRLENGKVVSITRSQLNNGGEQIILFQDVSEQRFLQELLAQQQHLSAMGEMVAGLAHQVRTPLATAILYASQLSKPELVEETRLRFSEKILERLHHLERQVNDMLVFAKQGHLAMQHFSLAEMLVRVAEFMECFSGHFALDNKLENAIVLGNQDALRGAVTNLLNNAVEAGASEIYLAVWQSEEGSLCLSVRDDGDGIAEPQLSRLFEPFYTTKREGTGLGLAVVDSVVKAHKGTVVCHSAPGLGSTFTLTLPCYRPERLALSAVGFALENSDEAI